MNKALIAAVALIGTTIPAAAFAQSTDAQQTAIVYKDLNLSTSEGQAELDRRIENAARQICGLDDVVTGSRIKSAESRKCYKQALSSARRAMASVINQSKKSG